MARLGLLTIGQAPRPDGLARDVGVIVGADVDVIERGALDGLSAAAIDALRPGDDEDALVTLLADGRNVVVTKRAVVERLQKHIDALERERVSAILLMCTGAFPPFRHRVPLIAPQEVLYAAVRAVAGGGVVGSVTPLERQVEAARRRWQAQGVSDPTVVAADPYCADPVEAVRAAAASLRASGAAVCFLDCFGFDLEMRDAARAAFGGPVVLARSLAARIAAEVMA